MSQSSFKEHIKSQQVSDLYLNEDCITCAPTDTILTVAEVLVAKNVGSVIIIDKADKADRPLGIFTERDLVRCVANRSLNLSAEPVSNQMTSTPSAVSTKSPLIAAMATMRVGKFRHLVITDESGALTGVISIRDIMVHLLDELNSGK